MRFVEVLTILCFNILIVMVMQHFNHRALERRLKRVNQEVRELEDLVAAIIEEFEAVAVTREEVAGDKVNSLEIEADHREHLPVVTVSLDRNDIKSPESKHEQIIALSDQGLTVSEIARDLGVGRGEVNLILDLYRRS